MYSIDIEKRAEKFLKKIPKRDSEIILKKVYSIRHKPFHYLKKLKGNKLWRLRIMKYRAIIDVVVSGKKIMVVKIGYRKNTY